MSGNLGTINVTSEQMNTAAHSISSTATNMQVTHANLIASLEALSASWSGEGKDKIDGLVLVAKAHGNRMVELTELEAEKISQADWQFEGADKAGAADMSSVG